MRQFLPVGHCAAERGGEKNRTRFPSLASDWLTYHVVNAGRAGLLRLLLFFLLVKFLAKFQEI